MQLSSIYSSIAILIFSWSMGFLAYYILSGATKEEKLTYMGEILSQLINFVIFIWIGKIILNFKVFIGDPLAILAYPGNSNTIYLATSLSLITIVIQLLRRKMDGLLFWTAFIYIFLTASFVYEFVQVVWNNNTYSIEYMGLVAALLIAFVIIRKFIGFQWLNLFIFLGWTIGSLILAIIKPILIVFGYTIEPWFLAIVLMLCCLLMVHQKLKGGILNGWN